MSVTKLGKNTCVFHLSFVNNAKMDKAISMKFSVNELVSCMCLQMYFSYQCGPFFKRNRNFCNEKPKNYLKKMVKIH
jgi:hypothetical protein